MTNNIEISVLPFHVKVSRPFKCIGRRKLLQYHPPGRHSSQGTSNNRKWTMPETPKTKNTLSWSPRIFVYCFTFNLSYTQSTFFMKLIMVIFIYEAFKIIQGLLWKIQGYSKVFLIFKDFSRPVETMLKFTSGKTQWFCYK